MFARVLGGFVFLFGAGTASAQLPIPIPATPASVPAPINANATSSALPSLPAGTAVNGLGGMAAPANRAPRGPRSAFDTGTPLPPPIVRTQAAVPMQQPMAQPMGMGMGETAPSGMTCTDLSCCNPCQTCCQPCCYPPGRVWMNAEWLFWVTSGQPLPPLVTASNTGGNGALVPGNTLLYGGSRVNNDWRSGLRVNGGFWLDECHRYGIETDFFFLGNSSQGFALSGTGAPGTPLIARPFFDAVLGIPSSELVAVPGILSGTVTANAQSSIIGGGFNFRHNLCCTPCGRFDLIYGYRYFNLTDEVTITEDLTTLPGGVLPAGVRFQIVDRFRTSNNFNGGVIGLVAERQFDCWVVGGRVGCALGANYQTVDITGATTTTPPGGVPTTLPGGLLTQTSNIGHYERSTFAVMPEVGVKLGCQLTNWLQVYAGYNFLYLSNVVRAGDQIDLRVNPNLLPPANGLGGPALPGVLFKTTDFWAQGVSVGARLSY